MIPDIDAVFALTKRAIIQELKKKEELANDFLNCEDLTNLILQAANKGETKCRVDLTLPSFMKYRQVKDNILEKLRAVGYDAVPADTYVIRIDWYINSKGEKCNSIEIEKELKEGSKD